MSIKNISSWWQRPFNGPQSLGRGKVFWISFWAVTAILYLYPLLGGEYEVNNLAYFLSGLFLALGLSLIWGHGDVLSFGQMAFFGMGGYAYGIIGINLIEKTGNTNLALLGGILFPLIFALILGYFMFYGRVSGVYVSILTLVTTLVFETFLGQTAGPQWAIGKAELGGYNGMTNIPPLQLGFGKSVVLFDGIPFYYFVLTTVLLVYLWLRHLVNSKYGNSLVATGSNPERTEVFGYDIRLIQLISFAIAGGLAGFSGVLYVSWGRYITPSTMGLTTAALPVIWVAIGGRKSLLAAIISAMVLQYFTQFLSITGSEFALVMLGVILVLVVMYIPEGIIPPLARRMTHLLTKKKAAVK